MRFQDATEEQMFPSAGIETMTKAREAGDPRIMAAAVITQTMTNVKREEMDQDASGSAYFAIPLVTPNAPCIN